MASTQLELARQQVSEEQKKLSDVNDALSYQQRILSNPNLLRQNKLSYLLSPKYKTQRIEALAKVSEGQAQVEANRQELGTYGTQLQQAEQEDQARQQVIEDYRIANKVANSDNPNAIFSLQNRQQREFYKQIKNYNEDYAKRREGLETIQKFKDQGLNPVIEKGQIVGFSDIQGARSVRVENLPSDVIERLKNIPGAIKSQPQTNVNVSNVPYSSKNTMPLEFGGGVELPGLTARQQYYQSIADYGKIRGTLGFLAEKVQGGLSQLEYKYAPRGQSIFSTEVGNTGESAFSFAVQQAPYFIGGGVGLTLIAGAGAEQAFNKNLPLGQRAIGAGTTVLASVPLALKIGELANLPKLETVFLSKQIASIDDIAELRTMSITKARTALGPRTYISGAITKTASGAEIDGAKSFQTITEGIVKQVRGRDLLTNNIKFSKGRPFISGSVGNIIDRPLLVETKLDYFNLQRQVPGYEIKAISRTFTGRNPVVQNLAKVKEAKITTRFNYGLGAEISEDTVLTNQLGFELVPKRNGLGYGFSKSGKSFTQGLTRLNKEDLETQYVLGRKLIKTTKPINTQENILKSAIEDSVRQDLAIRNEALQKAVITSARVSSALPNKENLRNLPTIVGGQGGKSIYQNASYENLSYSKLNKQDSVINEALIGAIGLRSLSGQATKARQRQRLDFAEALILGTSQSQASLLRQQQQQQQRQSQETVQESARNFGLSAGAGIFGGSIPKFRRRKTNYLSRTRAGYILQIRKKGKYRTIATGLPRGQALKLGEERTLRDLSRQFRIIKSGITEAEDIEFRPSETAFRNYKVRAGRQVPLEADRFIQKISANLQTTEEKSLIRQARLQANPRVTFR